MSIYIGNLPYEVTSEDLNDVFSEYGTVKRVSLPMDPDSGQIRGFAFVDLASSADEDRAIDELDQAEWIGRELRVNKAKPRNNSKPRKRYSNR